MLHPQDLSRESTVFTQIYCIYSNLKISLILNLNAIMGEGESGYQLGLWVYLHENLHEPKLNAP